MQTIIALLQKEFRQIFRNKGMLPVIFGVPIIQLLILSNAATFEIKVINMHVVDLDKTRLSRELIGHFSSTGIFRIVGASESTAAALADIEQRTAWFALSIPQGMQEGVLSGNPESVQILINSVDGFSAGVAQAYAQSVVALFNAELAGELAGVRISLDAASPVVPRYLYNNELSYKNYMVPGILVLLVTIVSLFLSAMNVVREREIGTIEQLNVSPMKRWHFIVAKLFPFLVIALFELSLGLCIAAWVFRVPMVGSLGLLYLIATAYIIGMLGLGLLISTITDTQQQAMFIAWFLMVLFILMSGLFTPIESMPSWARVIADLNPVAWLIEALRRILLKGSNLDEVYGLVHRMLIFAPVSVMVAILLYRKGGG